MLKLNKKGFTLIELLVVIAIIGILASIVLVSLNDARNKGYDTEIKSELQQVRNAMEMCYDNNGGTYTGCAVPAGLTPPTCSTDAGAVYSLTISAAPGTAYQVHADLCTGAVGVEWCVDSTGRSVKTAAIVVHADSVCP